MVTNVLFATVFPTYSSARDIHHLITIIITGKTELLSHSLSKEILPECIWFSLLWIP
jgi:hypothetical protein